MAAAAAPRVEMQIVQGGKSWGAIVIELDEAKAPLSAANFLRYVESGYYDGTIFHRVIPTFMIQGGGYTAPNSSKAGGFAAIKNEAKNGLKNTRGTLAMARTSDPHSATSQFFINVDDNDFLDHPGQDGWGYCVFGKVVSGIEIVDRIKDVPTKRNPQMGENSQPVDPPVIVSAKRVAGA